MSSCPGCIKTDLKLTHLDHDLPAHSCTVCGGAWVQAHQYHAWLNDNPPITSKPAWSNEGIAPQLITDADYAKICPDCGRFLRRYKFWPDDNLHLEHCSACHGVWIGPFEVLAVRQKNLWGKINLIFTGRWQQRFREAETRRRFEKMYLEKFGERDYDAIKRIRRWLEKHPKRSSLMAYLLDDDPYIG